LLPLCAGFFVLSLLLTPLSSVPAIGGMLDVISFTTGKTCELLCSTIIKIVKYADTLPLSHFNVVSPPRIVLCAIYIIALFATSELFRIMRNRVIAEIPGRVIAGLTRNLVLCICFFLATLFTISTSAAVPFYHYHPTLAFVDIGQGDCLHIRTPESKNYLIDSGGSDSYNVGENILKPYLLKNGISHLDGVFVTHLHTDHFKGITELAKEIPIGPIFVYAGSDPFETEWTEALTTAGITKENIIGIAAGDSVSLDSKVNIHVLYPPAPMPSEEQEDESSNPVDENLNSLIMKVDYDGVTAMMTGDIGFPGEESLLDSPYKDVLHADILKVAHHGSKYSTSDEFLTAVNPTYAVIQSGKNTYGHPTTEILEKLNAYDTITFREDLSGMIDFKIVNGKVTKVTEWQQLGIKKKKLTVSN
jgi:competence protein ComEC